MQFIPKLLQIFFMEIVSSSDPHLHKNIFKIDTHDLYKKDISKLKNENNISGKMMACLSNKSKTTIFQSLRYEK